MVASSLRRHVEAVVVGAGIAGAMTALYLRRAGLSVKLVDAWDPGHARAASAGTHRLIRSTHGTDELYTLWSREARLRWMELSQRLGRRLYYESGVVVLAAEGHSEWEDATQVTFSNLGIPFFIVPPHELPIRLPVVNPRGIAYGLWEPESGFIMSRKALVATVGLFRSEGGEFELGEVETDESERPTLNGKPIQADLVVMACGAWMRKLFPRTLGRLLTIVRQDVILVSPSAGDTRYDWRNMPGWIDHGYPAYGVPAVEGHGFKAAFAWHHATMDIDRSDRVTDPSTVARCRRYLATRFPELADSVITDQKVCQIVNTPDRHFIIDRHPDHENLVLVTGGSGHLYKHGPVVGEFVAGFALNKHGTNQRFRLDHPRTASSPSDDPQ
ncbi:MAG: FAD-dependent oxidoreductase [bacterium]|nr:FAD-dependent oxidoreductase [Acidimicrobiia bacterium]MCY4649312.1 FAD-dependent oxidoreductase [bacterium]